MLDGRLLRIRKIIGASGHRIAATAQEQHGVEDHREIAHQQQHGPYISSIVYQAQDLQRAWDDALWAGLEALQAPTMDEVTGVKTAYLREPCGGNSIMLREPLAA